MPFPESERVIYAKNPLEQVICQLRFPAILRIETEIPVEFQEKIRHSYPIFREKTEVPVILPPELAEQIPQEVVRSLRPHNKAYDFQSADENWVVSLTNNFLALTSNNYMRWEEFQEHLLIAFDALKEVYSPAFFSRIGLRYQNVIRKSDLGLEDFTWPTLLNPYIVGELASPEISNLISEIAHIILMKLDEGHSQVRIRHGFARDNNTGKIVGYIIDNDFFTEQKTEINNAINILTNFNRQNRQLFRWFIKDRLHDAMGPKPVG